METDKDNLSEGGDPEDIPSDFFDDFSKDDFMAGLSVVDECWEDVHGPPTSSGQNRDSRWRINRDAVDNVKDLRELIGENETNYKKPTKYKGRQTNLNVNSKYRWVKPDLQEDANLDAFIKPGSRRDPNKTNKAIKKDKEVKVQQFLAKSLESSDDLRPPGTELDDYYEDTKKDKTLPRLERESAYEDSPSSKLQPSLKEHHSPHPRRSPRPQQSAWTRHSPRRSSPRHMHRNPSPIPYRHHNHHNPIRKFSPVKNFKKIYSPQRHSPQRRLLTRRSPARYSPSRRSSPRRSPRRYSPVHRSPRRQHSRSPRRYAQRRSRSRSRSRSRRHDDSFLYPKDGQSNYPQINTSYQPEHGQQYAQPMHSEFPGNPGYSYSTQPLPGIPSQIMPTNALQGVLTQVPAYDSSFPNPYYGLPQVPQAIVPKPVQMPNVNPVPAPTMVPPPTSTVVKEAPYDALAQLVAEGKLSQQDYLKLTPNKGVVSTMDPQSRVMVLTRCNEALIKLEKLLLPNRLMLDNQMIGADIKYLVPKYCSPLKRQAVTDFSFTKELSSAQRNKQLVDSVISTLGLDKVVAKYRKKMPKDMKNAAIQTTKHPCDACEIRASTQYCDVGTSMDPGDFTSSIHTQVEEQDLVTSTPIYSSTGNTCGRGPISIAHLTPAQLVSQLAARAKTLKPPQEPPSQYQFRRPPNHDGQQYHPYNNYRY